MLEFQNTSIYGGNKRILDDFSLKIPDGAIMGLLGSDSKAKSMIWLPPAAVRPRITGRFFWTGSPSIRGGTRPTRTSVICPGSTGFTICSGGRIFELFLSLYKVNGRYRQKRMEEVRSFLASGSI